MTCIVQYTVRGQSPSFWAFTHGSYKGLVVVFFNRFWLVDFLFCLLCFPPFFLLLPEEQAGSVPDEVGPR